MNELSKLFSDICDGESIVFEKNRIYDVRPEDSFINTGYFCSNTAKQEENPDGIRYSAIYLKNKKNIEIDGNGATVLVHGKMTPLLFYGCENITVKNLVIDYAVPTMTEFTVKSNNGGEIIIEINPDCLYEIEGNTLYWCSEKNGAGEYYWKNACNVQKRYFKVLDPETELSRDFDRNKLTFEKIEEISKNTLKCILSDRETEMNPGEIFQTRNIIRDQVGSMFERCKDLVFLNLRVKFMHGLGMVNQFCENVTFRNCDFTPAEGRTIASTADFFQFSGCRGDLIIENCKARGAQDDYINVHGTHLRIVELNASEKTLVVRFMHPETWGFQAYEKGDRIEFIRWDTLIPYGEADVISYEKLNKTDIKLILSSVPDEITVGKDVIENASFVPNLYVRNCQFGPTCGRGILATTRGEVIIENNSFRKLWGPALLIEDDCNFWFESGYTKEIIFRNNEIITCNYNGSDNNPVIQYTPKVMDENSDSFIHGKLSAYNNSFRKSVSGKHIFRLEYLAEAEISGNYFDAPLEIQKKKSGNIIEKNNIFR
ncbi:MAG: hypothetical protein E7535_10150 [Ruminococcaceae bacterium]|nr:hypothetical protein [Oscillospiraceae bacterium]